MKLFGPRNTDPSAAPTVQFVPGDAFFMRRFDLPAGTEASEVPGFVELRFEELSPFPLDQLHHGFLRAGDGSAVFAYAAYRRRLPPGQAESWTGAPFVLPDFAPALKLRFAVSTVVLVRSATSLTALYFDADRELPARAASRALPVDAGDEAVRATRRVVLDLVQAGPAREVHLEPAGVPQQRAQGLTFVFPPEGRGEALEVVLPTADCWTMDVREPEFVAAQRKRLGVDLLFWHIVQGAVAALLLLVIGEVYLLANSGYEAWLTSRLNARQPEAAAIDAKNALAIGLDNFRGRAVHPFDMFRVLNRGRTPTLYFTEAKLEGMRMEIRGEASNMAEYNAYVGALRGAPELAGPPNEVETKIRDNVTTFTIVVNFRPGAFEVAQQQTPPEAPTP